MTANRQAFLGRNIVNTHYINGNAKYPINLSLYAKKETCRQKKVEFKTTIQLTLEQINALSSSEGVRITLDFDCRYFCHQIVEMLVWDWVTQARSNRIFHYRAHKTSVKELAKSQGDERFRKVTVDGQHHHLCALKA